MNSPTEIPQKAPNLNLGKNICVNCGKDFIVEENPLNMPGTKDFESVFCPYCEFYNGEVFVNGIIQTREIEE